MYHLKQNNLLIIVLLTLILLQSRSLLKEVKAISLRKHTSVTHESRNQLTTIATATTLNKLETTEQSDIIPISTEYYSSAPIEKNQFAIFYIDIPADKSGVSLNYYCLFCKGALNLYTNFNSIPTLSDRGNYLDTATLNVRTSTIEKGSSYNDKSVVRLYIFVLNTSPDFPANFSIGAKLFDYNNIGIIIAFSILTPVLIIVVLALVIVVYIKRKSWLQNEQYTSIFNNNNNKYNNFNHSQNNPSSLIQNTSGGSSSGGDGYGYGATVNVVGNNNQQQTTMDTIQQQSYQQQSKSDNEKK